MKDNRFDAPEPIFKNDEVKDADQFEHIGQSGFSATWSNIRYSGGKLRGDITFTSSGRFISAVTTDDFAVLDSSGTEQTGWTFDSVQNIANLNVAIPISATPPSGASGSFRLRMKASGARDNFDGSQVPPSNVDSTDSARIPYTSGTATINIPQNSEGAIQISLKERSFNIFGKSNQTGPEFQQYLGTVFYNTAGPTVTITSGGFDGNDTVYFYAYWEGTTATELANFTDADISVTGAGDRNTAAVGQPPNGYVVTLGSAMGSAYPFNISNLLDNTNSTLKVTIRANALGSNTNAETESSCIPYDTTTVAPSTPSVTITSGGFDGDDTVFFYTYWENATVSQLGDFDADDITITGAGSKRGMSDTTGYVVTVGSRMGFAVPFNVTGLPSGMNTTLKASIRANAIGTGTNIATESSCIPYDTRVPVEPIPSVTITSGGFDGNDTVFFYAYWENATDSELMEFTAADITVSGAGDKNTSADPAAPNGYVVTVGSRMGSAVPFSVSNLPDNMNTTLKAIIAANALGTDTNVVTESSCIPYNTTEEAEEEDKPQITISSGGFCPTSNTLSWTVSVTNASSTQFTALDTADITVNDSLTSQNPALNGTETIVNRGGNSFVVQVVVPSGRNGNASITIAANAMGTDTNDAITSACVDYDTRAATVATASWGTLAAQTGESAVLQGRITFATTTDVRDIEPGDFDVITTGSVVSPRAGWTMQVSHGYTNSSRAYVDVTAIPNGTFNTSFGLRLNATSVRSAGSSTLNAPAANVDSSLVSFDNRATGPVTAVPSVTITSGGFDGDDTVFFYAYWEDASSSQLTSFTATDITVAGAGSRRVGSTGPGYVVTLGAAMGKAYPFTVSNLPANMNTTLKATIVANALGSDTNIATESSCIPYDTRGNIPVAEWTLPVGIQTGTTSEFGLTFSGSFGEIGLADDDFRVTGLSNARVVVTLKSFVWEITLSSAAVGLSAFNITITGGMYGVTSVIPVPGSNNTKFDIIVAGLPGVSPRPLAPSSLNPSSVVINQTSYPGVTTTATQIMKPYQIDVPLPANQEGTFNLVLKKDSVTTRGGVSGPFIDSNSGSVGYNTTTEEPGEITAVITSGGFDGNDIIFFYVYWNNATNTQLGMFDADDITATGTGLGNKNTAAVGQPPNGYVVEVGSAMGSAIPFIIRNLPDNTNSNLKVVIRANALGSDTNDAIESSCVGYDTRDTTITTEDIPYLVPSNFPTNEVTGATVTVNLDAYLDGTLQNIDGLRPEDIMITTPDGEVIFTLEAV